MHKVLICGSRDWAPDALIEVHLRALLEDRKPTNVLVIHGGAEGVDSAAGRVATKLGIHTAYVNALWRTYHRAAGPIRNGVMLALEPDEAIAYSRDLSTSRGTANMVAQLRKAGVPVRVVEG